MRREPRGAEGDRDSAVIVDQLPHLRQNRGGVPKVLEAVLREHEIEAAEHLGTHPAGKREASLRYVVLLRQRTSVAEQALAGIEAYDLAVVIPSQRDRLVSGATTEIEHATAPNAVAKIRDHLLEDRERPVDRPLGGLGPVVVGPRRTGEAKDDPFLKTHAAPLAVVAHQVSGSNVYPNVSTSSDQCRATNAAKSGV